MEQSIQLRVWRCGLDTLHSDMVWEFWWISDEPGALQYVVWRFVDRGILMSCHGWLGQLEDFFSMVEINMIEIASCDGLHVGMLESSLDRDVAYLRSHGFARMVFDLGG